MTPRPAAYRPDPPVWAAIIGTTCLLLAVFQQMLWLVVPFVLALIIYYLLRPFHDHLLMHGRSRQQAAIVVTGAGLTLAGTGIMLVLPYLSNGVGRWQETARRYIEGGLRLLNDSLRLLEAHVGLLADARLSANVMSQINELTGHWITRHLPDLALGIAAWAPSLLLAPFLAFFLLRDGRRFKQFITQSVPNAFFERSLYLLDQIDRTARLYFVGLMQLTLIDATCLAIGLWAIGVDDAIGLGLLTAVLAWVPYVGSVLGCLIVLLVAATDFPGQPQMAYAAILLFIFVRLLDDFFFMPMTVGKSLKMHPLLTVLMIFVGGAVAGIPGLMLVLPLLGIVMVVGQTVGQIVSDPRLRARHAHARRLRQRLANEGLD